ncbi:MAG: DNA alkylation repair protein [Opitutaceae bacterium]
MGLKTVATESLPRDSKAVSAEALAELKKLSSQKVREGMSRFGLPSKKAWGVSVGTIQQLAKKLGRSQAVAELLWKSDVYEARLLAALVGEPEKLTVSGMDRWCGDFDNWGVVDTVCFKLFDQSSLAWKRVEPWARQEGEFQRRAGFVMFACLAAHADDAEDADFLRFLPLIEWGATDDRNFVKKGVSWALRMLGRKSPAVRKAALATARKLAESENAAARWVGRDALRGMKK